MNLLELTGVFVKDPVSKAYTAFFAQFPNVIAVGDTEEEATGNLFTCLQDSLMDRAQQGVPPSSMPSDGVTTRGFNLQIA